METTIVSTIANLPIANASEMAKPAARVSMKFAYADVTTEKSADGQGRTWVRLWFEGLTIPVFRNLKQAKADLSNYIDGDTATHLTANGFEKAFNKYFRNKEVYASASVHLAGSKYIVDENSTAYKHGINGEKFAIGTELETLKDGVLIDGFLRAALSEAENDALYEQELAYAREMAAKIGSGSRMAIFAD